VDARPHSKGAVFPHDEVRKLAPSS
jgi:hypothetical protein